ncbi:hypothetical protein LguiB_029788 [Lonicera macranthoides]
MDRDFRSFLIAGEDKPFPPVFSPVISPDDTLMSGTYSGLSFQSLLCSNQETTLMSSPEYNYSTSLISPPASFGFLNNNFSAISNPQVHFCSTNGNRNLYSVDFTSNSKLIMPKQEPLESSFHQLPDLQSFEHLPNNFTVAESSQKPIKSISPPTVDPYTLDSILSNFQVSKSLAAGKATEKRCQRVVSHSALARERRQKISDKTRSLQKLLPWDKKMDMATMLEEAYKYIKFLQAQISVLQSMPCDSSSFITQNSRINVFGGLENLNRQQLLQVLVNSPVAQTMLYSKSCCVYSIEQVAFLKKMAENKYTNQQKMAFDPSMLS